MFTVSKCQVIYTRDVEVTKNCVTLAVLLFPVKPNHKTRTEPRFINRYWTVSISIAITMFVNWSLIAGSCKRFLSSLKRAPFLWTPPRLLLNE